MSVSWLKKGEESAKIAKNEAVEAEKRKQEQGKLWRFFLGDKEDARITFIDGELSPEGFLLPPRFYEHNLYQNGSWNNFYVCPEKTNPDGGEECPICRDLKDRPALVAVFTIIDHRTFKSKDKTKEYKDTKKLFVAKPGTFELLNKLAAKRGGLAGTTWDVSRTGDKAASVGSMFDFVEKKDIAELKSLYTEEQIDPKTNKKVVVTKFVPADYEKEFVYRTGTELLAMGFGTPSGVTMPSGNTSGAAPDYDKQL